MVDMYCTFDNGFVTFRGRVIIPIRREGMRRGAESSPAKLVSPDIFMGINYRLLTFSFWLVKTAFYSLPKLKPRDFYLFRPISPL